MKELCSRRENMMIEVLLRTKGDLQSVETLRTETKDTIVVYGENDSDTIYGAYIVGADLYIHSEMGRKERTARIKALEAFVQRISA
ncbi:hypothetical protein IIA94_01480 [Patescibacteria group bacterium]|nr:hypothetical protein [Patescibacteria group bacterium]